MRDDLEAYALGALEHARAHEIEDHIERVSRDAPRSCVTTSTPSSHLALAVPLYRASPRLKTRVMGGTGSVNSVPGVLRTRWVMAAAAMVLLAFAIGGVVWASILSSEVSNLKTQNERLIALTELDAEQREAILQARSELNSARSEQQRLSTTLEEYATLIKVALDPDLVPTELQGTALAGSANCSYVWSMKQSIGALTCKNLPAIVAGTVYELWATRERYASVGLV